MSNCLRPHDSSLPGSSVPRDSPGKNTGVGCHALFKSLSHVQLFVTPWTIQSMEFSRPEYWSSLSLLQGIFPTQGSSPALPHCGQILYQLSHKGIPVLSSLYTTPCSTCFHGLPRSLVQFLIHTKIAECLIWVSLSIFSFLFSYLEF